MAWERSLHAHTNWKGLLSCNAVQQTCTALTWVACVAKNPSAPILVNACARSPSHSGVRVECLVLRTMFCRRTCSLWHVVDRRHGCNGCRIATRALVLGGRCNSVWPWKSHRYKTTIAPFETIFGVNYGEPFLAPSNTLVIPRRRGGSDFSNFREKKIIARAPSRIRTNPETRVDLIRLRKNLELELRPNSFEKWKSSLSRGYHNLFFPTRHFFCRLNIFLHVAKLLYLLGFELREYARTLSFEKCCRMH